MSIKKDHDMTKYDFVFEWKTEPTDKQVDRLKEEIKSTLTKLNITYKITEG